MSAVDVETLKRMLAQEPHPALINTLPKEHFANTHIPESINVPQDQPDFVEQVEQAVGGRDHTVVVYCASQECDSSSQAARKLERAGFTHVYDFEGGAKAWQESGEALKAANA